MTEKAVRELLAGVIERLDGCAAVARRVALPTAIGAGLSLAGCCETQKTVKPISPGDAKATCQCESAKPVNCPPAPVCPPPPVCPYPDRCPPCAQAPAVLESYPPYMAPDAEPLFAALREGNLA